MNAAPSSPSVCRSALAPSSDGKSPKNYLRVAQFEAPSEGHLVRLRLSRRRGWRRHLLPGDELAVVRIRRQGFGSHHVDTDHHCNDAAVRSKEAEVADRLDDVANVEVGALWRQHFARMIHLRLCRASADGDEDGHDQL